MAVDRGQRVAHLSPVVSLHRRSHQLGQHAGDAGGARDQGRAGNPFLLHQQVPGETECDDGDHQGERQRSAFTQNQRAHGGRPCELVPPSGAPLAPLRPPPRQAGARPTKCTPSLPCQSNSLQRKDQAVLRRWSLRHDWRRKVVDDAANFVNHQSDFSQSSRAHHHQTREGRG
jgi:hypothetical protein